MAVALEDSLDSEEREERSLAPDLERPHIVRRAEDCALQRGNTIKAEGSPDSGEVDRRQLDENQTTFAGLGMKMAELGRRTVREVHYHPLTGLFW
jgi:hypothetical protein